MIFLRTSLCWLFCESSSAIPSCLTLARQSLPMRLKPQSILGRRMCHVVLDRGEICDCPCVNPSVLPRQAYPHFTCRNLVLSAANDVEGVLSAVPRAITSNLAHGLRAGLRSGRFDSVTTSLKLLCRITLARSGCAALVEVRFCIRMQLSPDTEAFV